MIKSSKFKLYSSGLLLLLVNNVLTLVFRKQTYFQDEADNLVAGKMVSQGLLLYKDFYSQHPPLMYYICGLISLLGAHTISEYRVWFYFFLSLLWFFIFVRYSKHFGKFTMALFPLLYIFTIGYTSGGSTILSEQIQATALSILFLELLLFEKSKTLRFDNYVVISLSIFFSLGTAVISAFPILIVCLAVFTLEIYWLIKSKSKFSDFLGKFFVRYIILAAVVAIPFLILIMIYLKQNVLANAYYQIFTFNTQVYSEYSGYGTNVFQTLQSPIYLYSSFFIQVINGFSGTNLIANIQLFIDITTNFLFVWLLFKGNRKVLAFFSFIFVIMCGTRGYEGFHSIPYYAVTCIMLSILINKLAYLPAKKSYKYKNLRVLIASVAIIIISTTFFSNFHLNISRGFLSDAPLTKIQSDILKITDKSDKIYMDNLDVYTYLTTDRMPASRIGCLVPWFSKVYQNQVINDLKASRPKIIVYDPNLNIWGYVAKNYESNVQKYIEQNYTQLTQADPGTTEWIRNDYVQVARQKLTS